MVFSTYLFIYYFLPLLLGVYYALPPLMRGFRFSEDAVSRARNLWLLCMSYVFYGWWNPWYILLMLFITVANYGCGWLISRPGATERQRLASVALGVIISLATLGFFKYFTFLQLNVNEILTRFGAIGLPIVRVVLPIGISFYTFQALSYSVDVYRRAAPPARSLADFACYIALFPQLIAGPIIRYASVATQLTDRPHRLDHFSAGVALFVLGLAKKVLLANPMGEIADTAFAAHSLHPYDAWFGVLAYALQIYFDFCGYSDMAVGLGRMLGFDFIKNFNAPYLSESITDFWRRWHISLSTFLRDYLYIPLGGNRLGTARTYFNLAIVMLLGGLWHGANWTFVVWGAYHGFWLSLERSLGKKSWYSGLPRAARIGFTWILVLFSWVLFRAETLGDAGRYLAMMFGMGKASASATLVAAQLYSPSGLIHMACAVALIFWPWQAHEWSEQMSWPKLAVVVPTFGFALLAMLAQSFNPFLYFQF